MSQYIQLPFHTLLCIQYAVLDLVNCCKNRKIKQRFNTQTHVISLQKKKRDCRKENISLNDRRNININPLYTKNFPFIFSNKKVSHDQCIIRTNMVASNRTVGQTSNDFIISGRHSIMHCKCTNALYQTYLIANIWQLFLHSYRQLVPNNNTNPQQVW